MHSSSASLYESHARKIFNAVVIIRMHYVIATTNAAMFGIAGPHDQMMHNTADPNAEEYSSSAEVDQ
jgi:hypothetical protein